ncbi:MAG: carbamate kinase [Chloroflexota bacterium]
MRLVVALGGNALLRRGEPMTIENQRRNVRTAAAALAPLARDHELVLTHGNGPQVGLLALQAAAYAAVPGYPLDVLGAETEGMVGYLLEQELGNLLPPEQRLATILTQIEVDPHDPAFDHPTKPIGPVYERAEAERAAVERGWAIAPDGHGWRRVVASPHPRRIFEIEVIRLLVEARVVVICAGGGGIPTMYLPGEPEPGRDRQLAGVEAVIDKDRAGALLASSLGADAFLMLTDADAVLLGFGTPDARAVARATPDALARHAFAPGSMGPKVEAACAFVRETGGVAGIGALADAAAILRGEAGTLVTDDAAGLVLRT